MIRKQNLLTSTTTLKRFKILNVLELNFNFDNSCVPVEIIKIPYKHFNLSYSHFRLFDFKFNVKKPNDYLNYHF